MFDYSVLYALSVDGLTFERNSVKHNTQYTPWQGRKAMLTFEACQNVQVTRNEVAADALGKNVQAVNMPPDQIVVGPDQGITGP